MRRTVKLQLKMMMWHLPPMARKFYSVEKERRLYVSIVEATTMQTNAQRKKKKRTRILRAHLMSCFMTMDPLQLIVMIGERMKVQKAFVSVLEASHKATRMPSSTDASSCDAEQAQTVCSSCQNMGIILPTLKITPTLKVGTDHILHQSFGLVNKKWVLLSSQLKVNIFCNAKLLKNICKADIALDIFSNAGQSITNLIGNLPGFKAAWYQPDGIANILSLSAQNENKYSLCDYSHAETARKLQGILGNPSLKSLLGIVEHNLLPNCPITGDDVIAAENMFGPDSRCLQGKMVRQDVAPVRINITPTPPPILEQYKEVTLVGDIMKIHRICFLNTMSLNINFITSENISNARKATLKKSMVQICQTIKERVRGTYNSLPYKSYPGKMIMEMAYLTVFWLNIFHHLYQWQGTYVHTHKIHNNNMELRTMGAIQGGINWNKRTVLPMPGEMIDRVHQLARQDPLGIVIEDRSGLEFLRNTPPEQLDNAGDEDEDEENSTYRPSENDGEDDYSLLYIPNIQDAPICHDTDGFNLTTS
eukprot:5606988-Ditylum_brightwellii.AAC.1